VKSAIASLTNLTLPFGAGTGQRIELDGTNGQIRVYDENNNLLLQIDGESGLSVYDTTGELRAQLALPLEAAYSALTLLSGAAFESAGGAITVYDFTRAGGVSNRMVIDSGQHGHGSMEFTLFSVPDDITSARAMIQVTATDLTEVGTLRPYIDLTGSDAPTESVRPYTVVYDLFFGRPSDNYGEDPELVQNYGRGLLAYAHETNDVVLSTTAGTYTTVVETAVFPVIPGRVYKIQVSGGDRLLTGGSGFTTNDAWTHRVQVSQDGGAYIDMQRAGRTIFALSWVATGKSYHVPSYVAYYVPPVGVAEATLRYQASKFVGAATVTSTMQTNAGGSPWRLEISDVGQF
jgi:hypothetical protein